MFCRKLCLWIYCAGSLWERLFTFIQQTEFLLYLIKTLIRVVGVCAAFGSKVQTVTASLEISKEVHEDKTFWLKKVRIYIFMMDHCVNTWESFDLLRYKVFEDTVCGFDRMKCPRVQVMQRQHRGTDSILLLFLQEYKECATVKYRPPCHSQKCNKCLWLRILRIPIIQNSTINICSVWGWEVSCSTGLLGDILFLPEPSALLEQLFFRDLDWLCWFVDNFKQITTVHRFWVISQISQNNWSLWLKYQTQN